MPDVPPAFLEEKLDEERTRNSQRLIAFRVVVTALWLAINAVLAAWAHMPGPRARNPALAAYCAAAVALWLAARQRPRLQRHAWLALPLLDLPAVFLFQLR